MLQEWNSALLANDDYWDQNAFNDLMIRGANMERRPDRLVGCGPYFCLSRPPLPVLHQHALRC